MAAAVAAGAGAPERAEIALGQASPTLSQIRSQFSRFRFWPDMPDVGRSKENLDFSARQTAWSCNEKADHVSGAEQKLLGL